MRGALRFRRGKVRRAEIIIAMLAEAIPGIKIGKVVTRRRSITRRSAVIRCHLLIHALKACCSVGDMRAQSAATMRLIWRDTKGPGVMRSNAAKA